MCLERDLTKNPLKRADTDIVCYKVVDVPGERCFKFKTWLLRKLKRFRDYETHTWLYPVTIGEIFIAHPVLSKEQLHIIDRNTMCIKGGFIHSFKNKDDAIKFRVSSYIDVVKCVIPAGAYYFEGKNNGFTDGYASTQIKYVKVI